MEKGKTRAKRRASKASRPHSKIIYLMLLATLAIFAAYLVTHPMAPSFYDDDTTYEMLAHFYLEGSFTQNAYPYTTRLLQIIPLALSYDLLGQNLLSNAMWDIVSSLLLVLITFYIGKVLYNEYAGYLAALIVCVFPVTFYLSASGNETIPMAMFASLAILSFIEGYYKNSSKWYFISGISIVAAFLTDPLGALIGVTIFVYMLLLFLYKKFSKNTRIISFKSMHVFTGIAVAILLLLIYNYFTSGNPFITFDITLGFASGPLFIPPSVPTPYYALLLSPFLGSISGINIGYTLYILIIAVPYLIIKKVKQAYLPIFWFGFILIYLWIGPMYISIAPLGYSGIPHVWRFFTLLAAPAAIIIAIFLVKLNELYKNHKLIIRLLTGAILVFILLSSLNLDLAPYSIYYSNMLPIYKLSQYLLSLPNTTTIYLPLQEPNIEVYMNFDNASRFIYYNLNISSCNISKQYDYTVVLNESIFPVRAPCPTWSEVNLSVGETAEQRNSILLYRSKQSQ
ncbi:MAG: ArnT family glycosyltransferase [Candidatus Micrarchaeia archaeon]